MLIRRYVLHSSSCLLWICFVRKISNDNFLAQKLTCNIRWASFNLRIGIDQFSWPKIRIFHPMQTLCPPPKKGSRKRNSNLESSSISTMIFLNNQCQEEVLLKDSTHEESLICLTVSLSLLERFTNKLQIIEVRGANAHLLLGCALYSLQHVNIQLFLK